MADIEGFQLDNDYPNGLGKEAECIDVNNQ